ncbi:MAG: hypothetical protein SF123_05005 [Chloroflexota bacterium]|nr:hypothetical protein [Chloroflexota bacterium]
MQSTVQLNKRTWQWAALFVLLAALFIVQISTTPRAAAQDVTPTPADPIWNAFSAARAALEEKYSVDLTTVRRWDWEQAEFPQGITSCVDNPEEPLQLYFGWRFLITDLFNRNYEARTSFDRTIVIACDRVEAAAAAPTAVPGAPDGSLPPPVAGSGATGSFELGGHVLELNAGTVGAMRTSGMTWVKKQLRYNLGDTAEGSAAPGFIAAARANGFRILLGVVGNPAQMGDFNNYINQYAQFVAGVARLGADAIEVWNEPNIDREWPAGQISGANYTRLLAPAYNAIKSANANTIVISGAPAPTGFFGTAGCTAQGCNDDTFMQAMAAAGAAQYFDCIGLHYNEGIVAPGQGTGDPRDNYPTRYFGSMLNRGLSPFAGKPACWTELGYLTPEGYGTPLPASFAWAQNTSVAEHTAWLADAARLSAQSGRVRMMIVWNVDFPFYTATDPMGGYAMIRPGGACPACDALGIVMRR